MTDKEPPVEVTRKWYQWYAPEDTPEERQLLLKLDLLIIPIALLSFWIKNMDYSNISRFNNVVLLRSNSI